MIGLLKKIEFLNRKKRRIIINFLKKNYREVSKEKDLRMSTSNILELKLLISVFGVHTDFSQNKCFYKVRVLTHNFSLKDLKYL